MRFSLLAVLSILLCAPAYAAQTDAPEAGATPTEAAPPAYPAAPELVAPTLAPSPTAVAPTPAPADGRLRLREPQLAPPNRDWNESAGTLGLSLAGVTLVAGLVNQATFRASPVSLCFTLLFVGVSAIGVPVVAFHAYSLQRDAGVEGSVAARGMGWLTYALSLAVSGFIAAAGDLDYLPITNAALAALAFACHGIDARASGKQARQKFAAQQGLSLDLFVAPTVLADGRAAASFGLAGRF